MFYDSILAHAVRLGIIPARFKEAEQPHPVDQKFYLARGRAPHCQDVAALEITKWFDSNYHYLVPELNSAQQFNADFSGSLTQVDRAKALNHSVKMVAPGLLIFLYLSRIDQSGLWTENPRCTDPTRENGGRYMLN